MVSVLTYVWPTKINIHQGLYPLKPLQKKRVQGQVKSDVFEKKTQ